jgi:hypothetical protein
MTRRERVQETVAGVIICLLSIFAMFLLCHLIVTEETEKMHKAQTKQLQVMYSQGKMVERGLK